MGCSRGTLGCGPIAESANRRRSDHCLGKASHSTLALRYHCGLVQCFAVPQHGAPVRVCTGNRCELKRRGLEYDQASVGWQMQLSTWSDVTKSCHDERRCCK